MKIVLRTGPTPTPTPIPKPTPTPAPPSIDVVRKGNAGERFTATGGSFTLTGTGVNYNQIRWNFLKGATMKVTASGTSWSVKISPLKQGVNTVQTPAGTRPRTRAASPST